MNSSIQTLKAALVEKLLDMGYEPDPKGDMICYGSQRNAVGKNVRRKFRVKFQDISVRFEVQGLEPHPIYKTLPWLRVTSSYYSQIVDCGDGRLRIGSVFVGSLREVQTV